MSTPFGATAVVEDRDAGRTPAGAMSAFVPLFILGLVMVAWFAFQAMQLRAERDAMVDVMASQEKPVTDSKKLRDALDALAKGTQQLADGGNANARLIVDELKKHGVTINPSAAAPADPAKPGSR